MAEQSERDGVLETMRRIEEAWLNRRLDDLAPLMHPDIVMVFPGFSGEMQGREPFLAGFRDFCENAKVHELREHDHHVTVAGDVAVATFRFEMVYERGGIRSRSTGRDFWVLKKQSGCWIAMWRTMLDVEETAA